MKTINKTVRIGKGPEGNVFCKIKFDGKKLSISGIEGPMRNGDCRGSCGQILDHITISEFADGWSKELANQFVSYWSDWHLNDMQAGTPKQTAFIENYKASHPDWRYDYTEVCNILKEANIYDDDGYKYGTAWLSVEVPSEVIDFLDNLPETDIAPAWV